MRILLVDDSRTMRNIMKRALESLDGVEFSEAGDGLEAINVMATTPSGFDLILVDWNMPNMDGLTFLQKMREKDKKTPAMMITTEAEKARVVAAIQAGASNYMVKPFTPETLLAKVNQTLAKCKAA